MRVAVLNDVHGNLPALEAVLAEVERAAPDAIVFGGDVFFGPLPRETLEAVLALGDRAVFVLGNTDRWFLDVYEGRAEPEPEDVWLIEQLDARYRAFFAGLPRRAVLEIDQLGPVLFCHGSPRSEDEIVTAITPPKRLDPMLAGVRERVVVGGHTHVQFDRIVGDVRLVNAGSVGMPYEDEPGARWALLGPDVELRRTPYDVDGAIEVIRRSAHPRTEHFIERYVLSPPSSTEATEHFERMAAEQRGA